MSIIDDIISTCTRNLVLLVHVYCDIKDVFENLMHVAVLMHVDCYRVLTKFSQFNEIVQNCHEFLTKFKAISQKF